MPAAPRTPTIEWRPGAAQLLPVVVMVGPWLFAIALTPAGQGVWPLLALIAAVLAVAMFRHAGRPRLRRLTGASNAIVLDDRGCPLRGAWLAPGWLMLHLDTGRGSRRLWIHASEVSAADFARLRRFARAVLPAITPRPVLARRGDR